MSRSSLVFVLLLQIVFVHCAVRRRRSEESPVVQNDLKITRLHVQSNVAHRFATTYVTSHVVNRGSLAAEAVFDLRLPKSAFISNFTMEVAGRNYSGTVKEKERAAREYDAAVSRGQSAAQVKKNPRATDRFNVNVNVEAGGDVTFYLVYQQLLKRRHGLYSDVIYVDPGMVVPDFRIEVHINETREITDLYVPPISVNDTEATMLTLETNPEVEMEFPRASEVRLWYQPSEESQRRQSADGLSGKFVVLYDVLRNFDGGDVLVEDGYFVHYFAPSGLPIMNKNVLFVLDTSGSMYGTKIRQVKDAMETILGDLREGDFFNIVRFSGGTTRFISETAMIPASAQNRQNAMEFVSGLQATGGTNVNSALLTAINLLGAHASASSHDFENELSSLIIFLTDGDPTVGVTRPNQILENVRELNALNGFPIYSLGFGQNVNFKFLKKISLRNSAMARKIYEDADAGLQLEGFFRDVSTPLLNDITFDYVGGFNQSSISRDTFPTYYNGSEIIICGRMDMDRLAREPATQLETRVSARSKDDAIDLVLPIPNPCFTLDCRPPPVPRPNPQPPTPRPAGRIEKLWAYMTIHRYMEDMLTDPDAAQKAKYKQKALELALKYQFVTDLTSMVVVKPDESESLPETEEDQLVGRAESGLSQGRTYYSTSRRGPIPQGLPGASGGGGGGRGVFPQSISQDRRGPVGISGSRRRHPHRKAETRPSTSISQDLSPDDGIPNLKQFGYSFADGDPHFLVTVPGSPQNRPLCFNVRGEVNSTYLLLNDSVNDVVVKGKMVHGEPQNRGNRRRTYFGAMTVEIGPRRLVITPAKIQDTSQGGRPLSWPSYNATTVSQDEAMTMPYRHILKIRLDVGAVLVVVKHPPRQSASGQGVPYLGFYVENIGLLSGRAEGLTGDFAHSRIEDRSRPGSTSIRFTPSGGANGRRLRLRVISRRNLATKQRVNCLFVGRNGRDVLKRPLDQYKISQA